MLHRYVSASLRLRKIRAVGAIFAIIAGGCSPSGTGTVAVKDRGKIQESLAKGAKVAGPNDKAAKGDDLGVKFRKSKGD